MQIINQQPSFNSHLLTGQLSCLGEFLVKFTEESPHPVSIRSFERGNTTKDMKVIMHNTHASELRGFTPGGMVGMTLPEILETLHIEKAQREVEIKQAEKNELDAIHKNSHSSCTQTTIDAIGFIRIFNRTVTTLSGKRGMPIALAIISQEITPYANLNALLSTYRLYHGTKHKAIECFSRYFRLNQYLNHALCYEELRTLLAMVVDPRHKKVAQSLAISSKTVSGYLTAIKNKLKPNIDIYMILSNLRSHYHAEF